MEVDLETGNRNPKSALIRNILIYVAMAWSVFQLYVSSPLVLEITPWMNADVVKRVHVSFAGFLAFLTYPALKRSSRVVIPWTCLLYTSPSPRDGLLSRMPSSA